MEIPLDSFVPILSNIIMKPPEVIFHRIAVPEYAAFSLLSIELCGGTSLDEAESWVEAIHGIKVTQWSGGGSMRNELTGQDCGPKPSSRTERGLQNPGWIPERSQISSTRVWG